MEKESLLQEAGWLHLQPCFGSSAESTTQLRRAGKGHMSRAADNSSEEGLAASPVLPPNAGNVAEEAPGNPQGKFRAAEMFLSLCSFSGCVCYFTVATRIVLL